MHLYYEDTWDVVVYIPTSFLGMKTRKKMHLKNPKLCVLISFFEAAKAKSKENSKSYIFPANVIKIVRLVCLLKTFVTAFPAIFVIF